MSDNGPPQPQETTAIVKMDPLPADEVAEDDLAQKLDFDKREMAIMEKRNKVEEELIHLRGERSYWRQTINERYGMKAEDVIGPDGLIHRQG